MVALQIHTCEEIPLSSNGDDLLTPGQAAAYLAELWQRPFTMKDFANMRTNAQNKAKEQGLPMSTFFPIEPEVSTTRITLWRRSDLDILAKTRPPEFREDLRRPRRKRGKSGD